MEMMNYMYIIKESAKNPHRNMGLCFPNIDNSGDGNLN